MDWAAFADDMVASGLAFTITYKPAERAPVTVSALPDRRDVEMNPGPFAVRQNVVRLRIRSSDLDEPSAGDFFTYDGREYRVAGPPPTDEMSLFYLISGHEVA